MGGVPVGSFASGGVLSWEGAGHDPTGRDDRTGTVPRRPDVDGVDRRDRAGHRGDGVLRAVPAVGEREHAAHAGADLLLPLPGPDVEPAGRVRGPGDGGPAGVRGRRRVHAVRAERAAQRRPVRRHRPGRRARGRAVHPCRAVRLPAPGRLLRHRHVGDRRGVPIGDAAHRVPGRRQRAVVDGEEHLRRLLAGEQAGPHLLGITRSRGRRDADRGAHPALPPRSGHAGGRGTPSWAPAASASTCATPSCSCG